MVADCCLSGHHGGKGAGKEGGGGGGGGQVEMMHTHQSMQRHPASHVQADRRNVALDR